MKFSIIIPVYNVAPYLSACLDSVLFQTESDWECICVDSVDHKVPIPGRYVNECENGHVRVQEEDEVRKYNVVETIGC